MPSRRKARQRALQILYQWDMRKQPVGDAINLYFGSLATEDGSPVVSKDRFLEELVIGTVDNLTNIDERISKHAVHWRMERMPYVDRNLLRLAVYEMLHFDTPTPVLIDEALELAREYAGEESVHFVNGVLDAVHREIEADLKKPAGRN